MKFQLAKKKDMLFYTGFVLEPAGDDEATENEDQPPADADEAAEEEDQQPAQERRYPSPPEIVALNGERMDPEALYGALLDSTDSTVRLELLTAKNEFLGGVKRSMGGLFGTDWGKERVEVDFDTGSRGYIGVAIEDQEESVEYSLAGSFGKAGQDVWRDMGLIWRILSSLATREVSPKLLAGPVGIFQMVQATFLAGFKDLLSFTALISINLAIINLFPLPVLDGGHIFFCVIESLRGRPLSRKYQEAMQQIGIVLLLMLMLYVTWNDIKRLRFFSPDPPQAVETGE